MHQRAASFTVQTAAVSSAVFRGNSSLFLSSLSSAYWLPNLLFFLYVSLRFLIWQSCILLHVSSHICCLSEFTVNSGAVFVCKGLSLVLVTGWGGWGDYELVSVKLGSQSLPGNDENKPNFPLEPQVISRPRTFVLPPSCCCVSFASYHTATNPPVCLKSLRNVLIAPLISHVSLGVAMPAWVHFLSFITVQWQPMSLCFWHVLLCPWRLCVITVFTSCWTEPGWRSLG